MATNDQRAPDGTSQRLKSDIDNGRTHDKTANPDYAAAPLGTDDEAAGAPMPKPSAERSRAYENRTGGGPSPGEHGRNIWPPAIIIGLAIIFSIGVIGLILIFLN